MIAHSPEWVRKINQTIGGSSAGIVAGVGRFGPTPKRDLWRRMRLAITGQPLPITPETPDMRRGRMLERTALIRLEEEAPSFVQRISPWDQADIRMSHEYTWAHAIPDAVCLDEYGKSGLIEIKVPRPSTYAKCVLSGFFEAWIVQCQHNLAVFHEYGVANFAILAAMDPVTLEVVWQRVEPDDFTKLMAAEKEFWEQVRTGIEPAEEMELTEESEPAPSGQVVVETEYATRLGRTVLSLKRARDDTAALYDEAKAKMLSLSPGASAVSVPGVVRVMESESVGRKTFDHKAAIARFPELDAREYWKQGKPYKTIRVIDLTQKGE